MRGDAGRCVGGSDNHAGIDEQHPLSPARSPRRGGRQPARRCLTGTRRPDEGEAAARLVGVGELGGEISDKVGQRDATSVGLGGQSLYHMLGEIKRHAHDLSLRRLAGRRL